MIIDPLRCFGVGVLVLCGWIATLALTLRLGASAPAVLVVLPPDDLISGLPVGAAIVEAGTFTLTLRGDGDLVAALYELGAPLVLPAGLAGCLPQAG